MDKIREIFEPIVQERIEKTLINGVVSQDCRIWMPNKKRDIFYKISLLVFEGGGGGGIGHLNLLGNAHHKIFGLGYGGLNYVTGSMFGCDMLLGINYPL